jgi:hypothetical protein
MPPSDEDALALTVDIYMVLLRNSVANDILTRLMDDIARSIRGSEQVCDAAEMRADQDYAAHICDEEIEYIEDLIGASFIVLQTKIRRVASRAVALNKALKRFDLHIPGFSKQSEVRSYGENFRNTGATLIELIWDCGNYFKHQDEWPPEVWDDDDPQSNGAMKTRKSVARVGIERSSTGNMRKAYEFFGVEPSSCARLAEKVQEWADHVLNYARVGLPLDPEELDRARARRYARPRRRTT